MSVYKHKNGYYGYNFMYEGKRYNRSFKGQSKKEVEQFEIEHKNKLINGDYDVIKRGKYSLKDLILDLQEYYKIHISRPNEINYVIDNFYKLVGNKPANQIINMDIEKYIKLRKGKVKNSTINRELDVIKRIFSLAIENNKLLVNPCLGIKKLRIENPPERYLTKDEEKKLLAVCNPIMKAIIIMALHTGMRQNEILSLTWTDIFFDENYLLVRNTKNNKPRKLPLTKTLKEELLNLHRWSEYVFTSPRTKSRYKDVKSSFSRAVKRAGIAHITFHKLRHTCASRLNEQGVDVITIQKILDHAELRTTQLYTHISSDSMIEAFTRLNEY